MAQHKPEGWKSYHHQLIIRGSFACSKKCLIRNQVLELEEVSENYTVISDTGFKTYKDAIMYTIKHMN